MVSKGSAQRAFLGLDVGVHHMGPVGAIQALLGGPTPDPVADGVGEGIGDLGGGPLGLAGPEPVAAPLQVGVEPALDGAGCHAEVGGDVLVGAAAMGHEDDLGAIAEGAFVGGAEQFLERLDFEIGQVNADHRRLL